MACLAGVLGHVPGDLAGAQLAAVFGAGQDAGAQLLAEADVDGLAVASIAIQAGAAGGLADRVAQLLGRYTDAGGGGAVLGAVEADDGVEVHQAARLELGDLRECDPDPLAPGALTEPGPCGEHSDQLDGEAVPQRRGVPVPQHRALVVVGRRVDRGAQLGIVGVVMLTAPARAPVVRSAVDRPERWRRQAGEDLRMLGDLFGDAFATTGHAGVDELPHVAAVLVRTRRTARLPPVATPHHQRAIGLAGGRVHGLVAAHDDATQPDRMAARARPANLLQPALALGITRPGDQALHGRGVQLVGGRRAHRRAIRRGHKTDTSVRARASSRDHRETHRNAHAAGETVTLMDSHRQAFQAPTSMVRKGSPVRVRKRALQVCLLIRVIRLLLSGRRGRSVECFQARVTNR